MVQKAATLSPLCKIYFFMTKGFFFKFRVVLHESLKILTNENSFNCVTNREKRVIFIISIEKSKKSKNRTRLCEKVMCDVHVQLTIVQIFCYLKK